jgi:hypothetical protein
MAALTQKLDRSPLGRRLPLGAGAAMQPFAEMRSLSIDNHMAGLLAAVKRRG